VDNAPHLAEPEDLLEFSQKSISLPDSEPITSSHTLTAYSFKSNYACVHQINLFLSSSDTDLVFMHTTCNAYLIHLYVIILIILSITLPLLIY
jgi:hypothetical protein